MTRICFFTGTRAEYGLLAALMHEVENDPALDLQLIVSGMHLSSEFGLTYRAIEEDGFQIDEKVEILPDTDTPIGISEALARGIKGIAAAYDRLRPDLLILLGDRFEAFAAAAAALVQRIPIAHLHGGESTEGVYDEAFRHSITKMSHLHLVATEAYRRRVIQLGEDPRRVFNVGAIGLDNLERLPLLSKSELEQSLHFRFDRPTILVTFHPVTLEEASPEDQFNNLLAALDRLVSVKVIFTKANADTGGRAINRLIDRYVVRHPERTAAFTSLGQQRYLSALRHVDAVVGNSSSGIIEAPSLGIPTINIGDRQKGRIKGPSVIDCAPTVEEIVSACRRAFSKELKKIAASADNPYKQPNTTNKIIQIIKRAEISSTQKAFYDLPARCFEGVQ